MPELSRAQLAVYAALAVVALMLGSRWIRSGGEDASASDGAVPAFESGSAEGESSGGGESFEPTDGDLVVHVAGAVHKPGVFQMPSGSRVTDAIERAGGTTADAAPDSINLAAPLADGQQIQVPAKAPAGGAASVGASGSAPDGPISLGTATAEELDTIEGIGPVTAASILEFRDQNGGVSSVDDLDQVSGIGPSDDGGAQGAAPAVTSFAWRAAALAGLVVGLALAAPAWTREGGGGRGNQGAWDRRGARDRRGSRGRAGARPASARARGLAAVAGRSWCSSRRWPGCRSAARGSPRSTGDALAAEAGSHVELRGTVASAPRTSGEITRFTLEAPEGRIAVESPRSDTPFAER